MAYFWHTCNSPICTEIPELDRSKRLRLGILVTVILSFAAIEWATGYLCHSLSLRSDAWHMVTDSGALLLALSASWLMRLTTVRRFPGGNNPDIIAAGLNALGLILMSVWIAWEGIQHLINPPQQILTEPMFFTATLGLIINIFGIALLHEDSQTNLNVRGAFLHMLVDLASSGGVIIGAVAIYIFQCFWLDGVISLLIVLFILKSAISLLHLSWQQWHSRQDLLETILIPEIGRTNLSDLIK